MIFFGQRPIGRALPGVMIVEEAVDGGLQIDHALEDATLETALGERREEDLDGVKEAEVTAVFLTI